MKTMSKTTMTVLGVAALALALVVPAAMARPHYGRGGGPGGGPGGCMGRGMGGGMGGGGLARLNLSEEQQVALQALRAPHMKRMDVLRADMLELHAGLRAAALRGELDAEGVERVFSKIDALRKRVRKEKRAFRAQVVKTLTDEQRAQLPSAWALAIEGGPGMRGQMMGRGGRGHRGMGQRGMGGGMGRGAGPCGWGQGGAPQAPPSAE